MEKNKKIVCISGMERSGTSMIARIVDLLGVYIGGRDDLYRLDGSLRRIIHGHSSRDRYAGL